MFFEVFLIVLFYNTIKLFGTIRLNYYWMKQLSFWLFIV